MTADNDYSDAEYVVEPLGAILILATGSTLRGADGVYRGLQPLIVQLCGEKLPRGGLPADEAIRQRLMHRALQGLHVPRLARQRIAAARGRPGIAPWLDALQSHPGLLDLLVLGRERLDI
ncbi:hypothetical protein [Rhodoglobus aureus]